MERKNSAPSPSGIESPLPGGNSILLTDGFMADQDKPQVGSPLVLFLQRG